jgi:putative holliday junction resolvase
MTPNKIIALDVGEKRIGVAFADTQTKIPVPLSAIPVDGLELERLRALAQEMQPKTIVVGLPRNQQGEETKQSEVSRQFAQKLGILGIPVVLQDESLTSVLAEDYLKNTSKTYTKEDIDAHAAAIILSDYLEAAPL